MNTNPYVYSIILNSHNGVHFDPSSGTELTFTVRSSAEVIRRYHGFLKASTAITSKNIGKYEDTGRTYLKRFAGHIAAADATVEQVGDAYKACVAASGTCLALLEGKLKPFEANVHSHPWIRGTVDLLQLLKRVKLPPGQRSAITDDLIEKFHIAGNATRAALVRHKDRIGEQSSFIYKRNLALMSMRFQANEQIGRHHGFSNEIIAENAVTAKLVLETFIKRRGKDLYRREMKIHG